MPNQEMDISRPASSAGEAITPPPRAKKRVGWHSASGSVEESQKPPPDTQSEWVEKSVQNILPEIKAPNSHPFPGIQISPGAPPDAYELSLALSEILRRDQPPQRCHEDPEHHIEDNLINTPPPGSSLRPPRPALRRNTSYDGPGERQTADIAASKATPRQQQSMTDARYRADRLAQSIGTHSSTISRSNSLEPAPSFQPLINDSDNREDGHNDDEIFGGDDLPSSSTKLRHRIPHASRAVKEYCASHTAAAESLVHTLTDKASRRELFHQHHVHHQRRNSGSLTPIIDEQDYVPQPPKYRGGILSSLLKLYQDERGQYNNSYTTTHSAPTTPLMSPRASPPGSRRSSATGGKHGRQHGLSHYSKSQHSGSTLSLTELFKSSSMFAVPGSREISDQWNEKTKKEKPPPKKKEQIRITVHIAGIISRHRYLMKLCRALMMYGAPTHRLEEYMAMSARVLEIEGQFLYIPSCMIISFDDSATHTTEVKVVRVPQGIDLGKLRDVHNIYKDVVHDKVGVEEATNRLDEVMQRDDKFTIWFRVVMYGIASACVAPFAFEGRFIDLPVAFLLGCIVGILQLVFAPSNELYAHVFEVSASIITSFIARGFGSIQGGKLFCFSALAQSSIALILPGYMVLCSSLELQSHNLVAGSVRMVYAMIYTLFLGYGITIGASLYGMMDPNATSATHCEAPLDRSWYFLFVPGFTMCLSIINQAKWGQTPVMLLMSVAGWSVNSYCSTYFEGNTQISNMLGALTVGILANLYSRLGRHMENAWLDITDWWTIHIGYRFSKKSNDSDSWSLPTLSDIETGSPQHHSSDGKEKRRSVGYSLAAAAMLPAIFVQVPSGLAAGGSLLAGITSADQITGNGTKSGVDTSAHTMGSLDGTAFNVLFSVIQVAIGISVGLFMSALIVYPLGKRRSGLFSF